MVIQNGSIDNRYRQERERYTPCPMLKMSVNTESNNFGPVSRVIKMRLGSNYTSWECCHALSAKKKARRSQPHLNNEPKRSVKDFWSPKSRNTSAIG